MTHAYTLVHLVLLARRVAQFNAIEGLSEAWRRRLPSNIFVQFLGAPEEDRYGPFGLLLGAILWVTLVVAPIALYLLLEIQFLPYHSRWITWTIRIALILDLGLLWWLWRNILASRARRRRARAWKTVAKMTAGALLTPLVVLFAWGVATITRRMAGRPPSRQIALAWARERLFDGDVDTITRRRASLFSNTLVLPEFNIYEALKIDDPKKVEWKQTSDRSARPRSERSGASRRDPQAKSRSCRRHAQLQGASLVDAQLQGASLDEAQLQGASLDEAQLQGASLDDAQLQGASLDEAQLQGASLVGAQLQGASLFGAQLQGASLDDAQLQGASLDDAQLQGASLDGAQLQGASLDECAAPGRVARRCAAPGRVARRRGSLACATEQFRSERSLRPTGIPGLEPERLPESRGRMRPMPGCASRSSGRSRKVRTVTRPSNGWRSSIARGEVGDTALASCDPAADPPDTVKEWKKMIEAAKVDQGAYAKALAAILGGLVCSNEPDRIYVLRGLLRSGRFLQTGAEMPALAKRITSPECPVSTALTDADKTAIAAAAKTAVASSKSP